VKRAIRSRLVLRAKLRMTRTSRSASVHRPFNTLV
jgi:hypothetical protein